MMAPGWWVAQGGTEMSRSWSDPVVPLDREYDDRMRHEIKKRQSRHSRHLDFVDDHHVVREWKRPRLDYPTPPEDSSPPPEFFIIKENSQSPTRRHQHQQGDQTLRLVNLDSPACPFRAKDKNSVSRIDRPQESKDHDAAAKLVEKDMADRGRRKQLSQHERILRSLIDPKNIAEYEMDEHALQSIFYAVNELFFHSHLKGRVVWLWKDLEENLLGTTGWRRAPDGQGFETLIFLSKQVFQPGHQKNRYNRRLLISTFIHELIHCYLFVACGYQPDNCGGHTSGFRRIAALINDWVGEDSLLQLHKIEAELSDFEIRKPDAAPRDQVFSGCRVQRLDDGTLGFIILPPAGLRLLD
ncbi:hypothetical protein F5Y16DRAFT_216572 [Xylariaceae sp. FL0255]|nr:hypothetical protein F5Y16DRAFT_216572 [Xylariaceae sp. FL0255]